MASSEKCNECGRDVERKEVTKLDDHDEIVLFPCGHRYKIYRRNITERISISENIISNPYLERDMTNNFVCNLYFRDHNELDVQTNGMDPFTIWNELGYRAFDQSVVPL